MACLAQKLLIASAIVLLASVPSSFAQEDKDEAAEKYQNRRRTESLLIFEGRIKNLPDAPMRCRASLDVTEFALANGPEDLFDRAIQFAELCLEDIEKNGEEFVPNQRTYYSAQFTTLLRKHAPERAERLLERYPLDDAGEAMAAYYDFENPGAAADLLVEKIREGNPPATAYSIIRRLRHGPLRKAPDRANEALGAILDHFTANAETMQIDVNLTITAFLFFEDETPAPLRERFLNFVVQLARRAATVSSEENTLAFATALLERSLPHIEKEYPAVFDEANAILLTLKSQESDRRKRQRAVNERIQQSSDKLAQAIREAELEENKEFAPSLWMTASAYAAAEGKYRIAVDTMLNVREVKMFEGMFYSYLKYSIISAAVRKGDFDGAEYAIGHLENDADKAEGIFSITREMIKKKDLERATAYFQRALKLLTEADASVQGMRLYSTAVGLAKEIEGASSFDIAFEAVKCLNRLPSPDAEDTAGTDGRRGYVAGTLLMVSHSIKQIIQAVGEQDADSAYSLAQGIQRSDLRLIAEIAVERVRLHPLPDEEQIEQDQQDDQDCCAGLRK